LNTIYLCADSIDKNECYKVLKEYTTTKLKDGHSFFCSPAEWKAMIEEGKHPVSGKTLQNYPSGKMLNNNIAYIKLPSFVSNDKALISHYADSAQNMIATFDAQNPKGYIIDLSDNGGGNCFPMIAGIGPLIGNGVCEMSFSGDGSISELIYNDGWTGRDSTLVFAKSNPYHLKNANKPIAVIYGNETASSGEVTAIAFIGLPNAKSFGQATGGYSTRIDNFEMSDGAYLNLASGVNADRNKNKFGGKIKPDVETKDRETALSEATKWILE
jgi:C-terminal processing protease CtpA/Prc